MKFEFKVGENGTRIFRYFSESRRVKMVNKWTLIGLLLLVFVGFAIFIMPLQDEEAKVNIHKLGLNQTTLTWKGQQWDVYSYSPNSASTKNMWVDSTGNLHMTLSNVGGKWYSTKIESVDKYQFGTYKWTVSSPLLNIDTNAVASMYVYVDDSNGIDIEATGWGNSSSEKLWFEVQPTSVSDNNFGVFTSPYATATNVTYSFDWEPNYIHFNAKLSDGTTIADWQYTNTSGIPQVAGTIIMETWLSNEATSDGKDIEVVYNDFNFTPSPVHVSEVESGVYDNGNFTPPSIFWSESARQIGGNRGIVDIVVGQAQKDGLCFVPFPYNNGVPKGYIYSWATSDQAEPYLKQLEKDNRKVILSIQPNNANVSDVLDLILSKYGMYKNVLGINIDTEWKNTGIVEHVNNTERDAWIAKIHSYNPDYKLFLTNYENYTYFPSDSNDIVILYDEQKASQKKILKNYHELATHFTNVGLYTGFTNSIPPTASDSEILEEVNNTKYILHNTWAVNNQLVSSEDSIMPGLWGRIYDSSSGKPIEGTVIYVYNDTWLTTFVPSANGEYWITSMDKGDYTVHATAPGYEALKIPTNITGVSVRQDIAIKPEISTLNRLRNKLGL